MIHSVLIKKSDIRFSKSNNSHFIYRSQILYNKASSELNTFDRRLVKEPTFCEMPTSQIFLGGSLLHLLISKDNTL